MKTESELRKPRQIGFDSLREKVAATQGRDFWRSLGQLAETEEFQQYLRREFPENASQWQDPTGRRRFLQLMGASMALAGLSGCTRQPEEKIIPYVNQPEELVPGNPLYFATAMPLGGRGLGVLAESHMGRPTKLEGNELHPASLGSTDTFAQASVLQLYDPDRSQVVRNAGQIRSWEAFSAAFRQAVGQRSQSGGKGICVLCETVGSPSLGAQIERIRGLLPQCTFHQYDPVNRDSAFEASQMVFGRPLDVRYRFEQADVVFSLDADFLSLGSAPVRYARDLCSKRLVDEHHQEMNRIYVAESCYTSTGGFADHRLAAAPSRIDAIARAVAQGVGAQGFEAGPQLRPDEAAWVAAAVRDLQANKGRSLVIAGDHQPAAVHALAHLINAALENVGRTVEYAEPADAMPMNQSQSLKELVQAMNAGEVEVLLILEGNPVYNAPADLEFAKAMDKVPLRVHLSLYEDETSRLCHWHVPAVHYLETWSDIRAYDGTVAIQQPLIEPLYSGRSPAEMLAFLSDDVGITPYEAVREYWEDNGPPVGFEDFWRRCLHDGVVAGTALPAVAAALSADVQVAAPTAGGQGIEIVFQPDSTIYDGRFANIGWLQEAPKHLTKLTWDNALLISPKTAEGLAGTARAGYKQNSIFQWEASGRMAELSYQGRTIQAALWVLPGHAEGCATLHLGYGRDRAGRVGDGAGFNAYALRTSQAPGGGSGLEIRLSGGSYKLACVQDHHSLEGRSHYRAASLDKFKQDPEFAHHMGHDPDPELTLYPEHDYSKGYAWGMTINLGACFGCNACVIACQAENNIPVVGKDQVLAGREMHWLRVDRYFQGDLDAPKAHHQPVNCMQCENAPCEPVCPVAATVHSDEGLNDMVYNRCVGTRYCANNCPYKVRRFNFFLYADLETPSKRLAANPDVTVRTRGVMEKCSYCVQRISFARIQAKREDRRIRDGDIRAACQQVCPTQAIAFGDINDPESRVAKRKKEPLNYAMLAELNTRPRTTYLAKVFNPNPELAEEA